MNSIEKMTPHYLEHRELSQCSTSCITQTHADTAMTLCATIHTHVIDNVPQSLTAHFCGMVAPLVASVVNVSTQGNKELVSRMKGPYKVFYRVLPGRT